MPHYNALCHNSVIVVHVARTLSFHLGDCAHRKLIISLGAGILPGKSVIRILEIRQVYIHKSVKLFEVGYGFVAAAIPYYRQAYDRFGFFKYRHKQAGIVGRSNKIYVVRSYILKIQHTVQQLTLGYFNSIASARNFVILAISTAEITARKENRAAASLSRNTRLLKVM